MGIGVYIPPFDFAYDALSKRPQHAAALGRIITGWSLIEGTSGGLLGSMLHSDAETANAILSQFFTNKQRIDAIRAIAKAVLNGTDLINILEALSTVSAFAKDRNKIAHGVWGVNDDVQDGIVWMPLKSFMEFSASISPAKNADNVINKISDISETISIYSLEDLESIGNNGESALKLIMKCYIDSTIRQSFLHHLGKI